MDSKQAIEALEELISIAERVDSWESFPSEPIEKARSALASLQSRDPVYYSITINGQHCGNFWPLRTDAEAQANRLNASYPQDRREVVSLYDHPLPQSALNTDAQKVRDQALEEFAAYARKNYNAITAAFITQDIRALQSQSLPSTGKDAEIAQLKAELVLTQARYQWAANELLACDYGDNPRHDEQVVGWVVYGWRDRQVFDKAHAEKRRIYGSSIDKAIDAAIAQKENG